VFGASIYARKFTNEAKTKNTPLDLYIKPHVQKSQSAREQKATAGGGGEKLGLSFLKRFLVEFELANQRALLKELKERAFPITSNHY
jgi:hypothetical protein